MNQFVKRAASSTDKPKKKLDPPLESILFEESMIEFNFVDFYYCNDSLFSKETNSLDDVFKSLSILETFRFEKEIIKGLIKVVREHGYISDVYFSPIGWLTGTGNDVPHTHVSVRIIHTCPTKTIETIARRFLSEEVVEKLSIQQTPKEYSVNVFRIPDSIPTALITVFPFDTDYILLVLFFGIFNDSRCGLSYVCRREKLNSLVEILKLRVSEITLIKDEVSRTVPVKIYGVHKHLFPEERIVSICEIVSDFDFSKFKIKDSPRLAVQTYIPKKLVSLIDLPCGVEIKCVSKDGIDFVTHLRGEKLNTVLIVIKDDFLKSYPLSGVFYKENLVWKGTYTYRITKSTFPVPELKISKNYRSDCKKHCFYGSAFITRVGLYIV